MSELFVFQPGNSPVELTRSMIDATTQSLLAVVYKLTSAKLYKALVEAKDRGVLVLLLLDGVENSHKKSLANKLALDLGGSQCEVRFWPTSEKLHAKLAVFDQQEVLLGSSNWSKNSDVYNVELGMRSKRPELVKQSNDIFWNLWDDDKTIVAGGLVEKRKKRSQLRMEAKKEKKQMAKGKSAPGKSAISTSAASLPNSLSATTKKKTKDV